MAWEERWQTMEVPWDAGAPEPALAAWIESLTADELDELLRTDDARGGSLRVLVPGCGAGYSASALAKLPAAEGVTVTGLDIAPSSRPRFEEVAREAGVSDRVEHVVGDFFEADLGTRFDLVYDYTFLCALAPSQREAWAARMTELIRPGGLLISIVFPIVDPPDDYEGPPWPLDVELVKGLVEESFEVVEARPITESHPNREGKEAWLMLRRLSER